MCGVGAVDMTREQRLLEFKYSFWPSSFSRPSTDQDQESLCSGEKRMVFWDTQMGTNALMDFLTKALCWNQSQRSSVHLFSFSHFSNNFSLLRTNFTSIWIHCWAWGQNLWNQFLQVRTSFYAFASVIEFAMYFHGGKLLKIGNLQ